MKLTATQIKLLAQAAESRVRMVSFSTGVITSRKRMGYGKRAYEAAEALAAVGFLEIVSRDRGTHHFSHRLGADHYTQHCYRITPKGLAAIEPEDSAEQEGKLVPFLAFRN